jgi:hypothetical protein
MNCALIDDVEFNAWVPSDAGACEACFRAAGFGIFLA